MSVCKPIRASLIDGLQDSASPLSDCLDIHNWFDDKENGVGFNICTLLL